MTPDFRFFGVFFRASRARLFRFGLFIVEDALAGRAEMDLRTPLDLVVELRRQSAHTSLAGALLRDGDRDPLAAREDDVVARDQRRLAFLDHLVALAPMRRDLGLDLLALP